jgi:hypothetical protein
MQVTNILQQNILLVLHLYVMQYELHLGDVTRSEKQSVRYAEMINLRQFSLEMALGHCLSIEMGYSNSVCFW